MMGAEDEGRRLRVEPIIPKYRVAETGELLDFRGERHIPSDVEIIPIQKLNEA